MFSLLLSPKSSGTKDAGWVHLNLWYICNFHIHSSLIWFTVKMSSLIETWWRHQMETFSALLVLCVRNSPVTDEFPSQRPGTRSFDVFFDVRLNKRLSKQSIRRWFETPSSSLWRHCNGRKRPLLEPDVLVHGPTFLAMSQLSYPRYRTFVQRTGLVLILCCVGGDCEIGIGNSLRHENNPAGRNLN